MFMYPVVDFTVADIVVGIVTAVVVVAVVDDGILVANDNSNDEDVDNGATLLPDWFEVVGKDRFIKPYTITFLTSFLVVDIFIALGTVTDISSFSTSFLEVVVSSDSVTVLLDVDATLLANLMGRYDVALGGLFSLVLIATPPTLLLLLLSVFVFILCP